MLLALELSSSEDGFREYLIPKLRHRTMTWMGWQTILYRLIVDDAAEERNRYTIESDSEYSGGETLVCTGDVEAIEAWISDRASSNDDRSLSA